MTNTPDVSLQINNTALTEAIQYCDFALKYNSDDYMITDGFIEKQSTPELGNYYPSETLKFTIKTKDTSKKDKSYLKKIILRNVTKSNLFNKEVVPDVLKCIFEIPLDSEWKYETITNSYNVSEEVLVCIFDVSDQCLECEIKIKEAVDFNSLPDYYLSYTVQYFYIANGQGDPHTCVFDPLIKITNSVRK